MPLDSFDAVFFDAGGTLLHPYPSVGEIYSQVVSRYGVQARPESIEKVFRQVWVRLDGMGALESHSDEAKERRWWAEVVEEVFSHFGGVERFEDFFHELYDYFARPEAWRLYPGALEVLSELKRQKTCVAIVSNWDSRLLGLCEEFGIKPHVDFILVSAIFGAAKPSPGIFEEALRLAGVRAERAVHIGDGLADDVAGARFVGIHTILIDRAGIIKKNVQDRHEPDRVIQDLRELLA